MTEAFTAQRNTVSRATTAGIWIQIRQHSTWRQRQGDAARRDCAGKIQDDKLGEGAQTSRFTVFEWICHNHLALLSVSKSYRSSTTNALGNFTANNQAEVLEKFRPIDGSALGARHTGTREPSELAF